MMGGVFYAMTLSQPAIGLNFGNMTMTPGQQALFTYTTDAYISKHRNSNKTRKSHMIRGIIEYFFNFAV